MRSTAILCIAGILMTCTHIFSQVPQAFQYQAVARDAEGNVLADRTVTIQLSLIQGSEVADAMYTETHTATTNRFGMVTLGVGLGTPVTGDFSSVNWNNSPIYLKVEIDPSGGSNFIETGTSQLLSVPYALFAAASDGTIIGSGEEDDAIFEVRNRDGQLVFGVYQGGVRIYVDESEDDKGARAGFAVGGFTRGKTPWPQAMNQKPAGTGHRR